MGTARFVSFVTLKSAGNKRMHKPQDLIKFEWEQEDKKGTGNNAWTKGRNRTTEETKTKLVQIKWQESR
jgi:hypothetical protein